jgi:hypothetical protein
MPPATVRARVDAYLRKSNALETLWRRPITGEQHQAELGSHGPGSRDTKTCASCFEALDNDPFVIRGNVGESIARRGTGSKCLRGR